MQPIRLVCRHSKAFFVHEFRLMNPYDNLHKVALMYTIVPGEFRGIHLVVVSRKQCMTLV